MRTLSYIHCGGKGHTTPAIACTIITCKSNTVSFHTVENNYYQCK